MKLHLWSTSWNAWHRAAAIVMSGSHCDANNPAVELPQRTAITENILTVYLTKQVALFAE